MSIIRLLDKSVADLIAAGEVVERPAAAVKELVENAIDAKADQIHIEILRGGISMIKVSDNGVGMTEEDAKKAFLKHATSKIFSKEDLFSIHTLGFRGEALCSIAAVSTVTLKTKTEDSDSGYMLKLKEGNIMSDSPTAYPRGTEITVEHLFENTPARFKFLKPEAAETTVITTLIENLALSHPEISFRLTVNGKERIRTYGNGNLHEAVFSVFGREFSDSVIALDTSSEQGKKSAVTVSGFIGTPLFTKGNRTKQLFYVNRRYIKSPALSRALENAYRNHMLAGRFPVCVIFLDLPPEEVDVNVHPGKTEVKFSDEFMVYDAVASAVSQALEKDRLKNEFVPKSSFEISAPAPSSKNSGMITSQKSVKKKTEGSLFTQPVLSARKEAVEKILSTCIPPKPNTPPVVADYGDWKIEFKPQDPNSLKQEGSSSAVPVENPEQKAALSFSDVLIEKKPEQGLNPSAILPATEDKKPNANLLPETGTPEQIPILEQKKQIRIVGEIFHTYIIVEKDEELVFIDKHALHERMNFEKLKNRPKASKMLLSPLICSLDGDRYASVIGRLSLLRELGFSVEDFGEGSVIIREIPELLGTEDIEPFLEDFAGTATEDKTRANSELLDKFLYDIACKSSIRAGKISSDEEIESLVKEYFENEATLQYCPHGRPILFTMNRKNIEKQFKRIV